MLKRLAWKESTVLSIKVREGLFTLAQMRQNHLLEFFDVRSDADEWHGVDLNLVRPIFAIFFAVKMLKPAVSRVLKHEVVTNERLPERSMLSVVLERNYIGAELVRLSDSYSSLPRQVIKERVDASTDLDLIYKYEFCGMHGDPVKLQQRLARFFDTGVNWDVQKDFAFPGIQPSPARSVGE